MVPIPTSSPRKSSKDLEATLEQFREIAADLGVLTMITEKDR
jgi:hypothetical protein